MMMNTFLINCCRWLVLLSGIIALFLPAARGQASVSLSPDLEVDSLSEHVYLHRSYLNSTDFGRVSCNGMVYVDSAKAMIFDTPTTPELTALLLDWLKDSLHVTVLGVVATHFHEDCLGGLSEVHRRKIPSIAHRKTQKLARKAGFTVPKIGFVRSLDMDVAGRPIVCQHLGEAHTIDNIAVWLPMERVLFGGCMVKSMQAGKGNLADANVAAWPATLEALQLAFPQISLVIPGHGAPGGPELLDYTIRLFRE